jgi:pimeloyl-ACP methyl ester carboxylesterase
MLLGAVLAMGAARLTDDYADLPGVRLWFTDSGGAGPAVVLLHANTGTSESWKRQVGAFRAAGFRVVSFDRRGWGRSVADSATGPQPGSVAEDLDALMTHLGIESFHLVGVAGGGFVALDYAAWRPERLLSLVVAASTGSLTDSAMVAYRQRIAIPTLNQQPGLYREVGASYRGSHPQGVAEWLEIEEHARQPGAPTQPLRSPNTVAKIAAIQVPTLVLAADADLIAPPGLMKLWAAHLRDCRYDFVPDAGHSIAWEQPEIFNAKVIEFLRGGSGPASQRAGAGTPCQNLRP